MSESTASIESGVYFIQNAGTGTVMDLTNGSDTPGTRVQGFRKRGLSDDWVSAQLWIIARVPSTGNKEIYTIQNANSRTFISVKDNVVDNGTPIIGVIPDHNRGLKPSHEWFILRSKQGGNYVIRSTGTGTYADLYNGGSANHTEVNGWAGEGAGTNNKHQLWKIVRA